MRLSRRALCTGRSTAVVVVLLMSTFIIFDSYTYQLFSSWSNSVSFDIFISSSKDVAPTIVSSSQGTFKEPKSISQPGTIGVGINIELESQVEEVDYEADVNLRKANQASSKLQKDYSVNSQFRTSEEKPESDIHDKKLPNTFGDLPAQPEGRIDQTKRYLNGSETHDVNDEGDRHVSLTKAAKTSVSELTSIQRVELDLWQARAALRRVALTQMSIADNAEGMDENADGEFQGEAYKNAGLFHQSYEEMESRFKIYIYQEGEKPLVHDGPCKEIYAVEGRFIQELQDDNPFVTSDPEEAHVYFLPFSVAMMVTYLYTPDSGDMSPLKRFVQDYVDVVANKYPYWNRSEGADHFMLSCHDWGPYVSRVDENLYAETIRVLCNANTSEGFIPFKDASLPEIHLVGGEVPTDLGGLPVSARTYLAFFAGADHGPVRPQLFKHWEGKDSDIVVHHRVPAGGTTYHDYMKSSKFCICPGGYEVNSPRVVEAIYNDCIPVIIADKFVLPFSDVLDWATFSLQVLEEDIPKLKEILEAVPLETLKKMQNRVKKVRKHFLFNQPPERYRIGIYLFTVYGEDDIPQAGVLTEIPHFVYERNGGYKSLFRP